MRSISHKPNRRDKLFSVALFGGQFFISTVLSLLIPSDVLTFESARIWVFSILKVAPKLLNVPSESLIPQVVIFYHATMVAIFIALVPVALFYGATVSLRVHVVNIRKFRSKSRMIFSFIISVGALFFAWLILPGGGYGFGRGELFWYSRITIFLGGFIPYWIMMLSLIASAIIAAELFFWSKKLPWLYRQ
ncbi:hypothetical protein [Pandoraea terrae]|uniref:hypothetical protein n=1 Tax=Pandoraea terrae TaxID=1537710 RepID=UPI0012430A5A|nr:hypothetical protein [Pandoraea terrae]